MAEQLQAKCVCGGHAWKKGLEGKVQKKVQSYLSTDKDVFLYSTAQIAVEHFGILFLFWAIKFKEHG